MFHSTFKISPSFQEVLIEDSNLFEKYRFFFQDIRTSERSNLLTSITTSRQPIFTNF